MNTLTRAMTVIKDMTEFKDKQSEAKNRDAISDMIDELIEIFGMLMG